MRILVTGAKGQLGIDVCAEIKKRGYECIGIDIEELDITDKNAVDTLLNRVNPDAVIHCAAWTAVDAAEETENIKKCFEVNARGTMNVAEACRDLDCKLLYLSTDYVFGDNRSVPNKLCPDGKFDLSISPDCEDFEPQGVYAKSKLIGEIAVKEFVKKHFIVRISWVFGKNGKNFVDTMLKLAKTHDELRVVNDQVGRPTYTPDLARLLVDIIESERYGIYHATNEGENINWADYAREIFRLAGLNTKVIGISTEEYGALAQRPLNSRLDTSKLEECGFKLLPEWKDALKRYLSVL